MTSAASAANRGLSTDGRPPGSVREAMGALESALAIDGTSDLAAWGASVRQSAEMMQRALARHATKTEGDGGFHHDIVSAAPRLSADVGTLVRDHAQLAGDVEAILGLLPPEPSPEQMSQVRDRAAELMTHLGRHQQRGADLLYEAYEHDIGGQE